MGIGEANGKSGTIYYKITIGYPDRLCGSPCGVTIPVKNCLMINHSSEITLLIWSLTAFNVIKCSFESYNRKKQKNTKTDRKNKQKSRVF